MAKELDFSNLGQGAKIGTPAAGIPYKDRTTVDDLTDVSWLDGDTKESMKQVFHMKHGQYFENGVRVTDPQARQE